MTIVMVCARSHSFWRTIKGRLRWSLRWWPPHHCSVPLLPLATLIGLILELRRNSSLLQYHQQIYILIIAITNQHHVLPTAAQPEPHHTPHTFHVLGQSYRARTSSRGHGSWSPQEFARIWVSILWHLSVRATAERLSWDLAGDPKYIYKHKYDRKAHLAGDPKRKG